MVKNTFTHVLPESISELTNLEILYIFILISLYI